MIGARVPTCNPKITPYSPIHYLMFDTIHQAFQDDDVKLLDLELENILWLNGTIFIKGQLGTIWGAQRQKWDHVPFSSCHGIPIFISDCVPCEAIKIWPSNKLLLAYLLSIFSNRRSILGKSPQNSFYTKSSTIKKSGVSVQKLLDSSLQSGALT